MTEFWPWWMGGAAVAIVATAYPWVTGWLLGVSSVYAALLERLGAPRATSEPSESDDVDALRAALLAATLEEFGEQAMAPEPDASWASAEPGLDVALQDLAVTKRGSRALFLAGMIGGGTIGLFYWGRPFAPWTLGSAFDLRFGGDTAMGALALFGSGILIGFGTRMAGGCTSGHGISGMARFERGSALSTISFWLVGAAVGWAFHLSWGA